MPPVLLVGMKIPSWSLHIWSHIRACKALFFERIDTSPCGKAMSDTQGLVLTTDDGVGRHLDHVTQRILGLLSGRKVDPSPVTVHSPAMNTISVLCNDAFFLPPQIKGCFTYLDLQLRRANSINKFPSKDIASLCQKSFFAHIV